MNAIAAGMMIGLGCIIYLMCPDKTLGAFLFACGLAAVRIYRLPLYTGQVQNMVGLGRKTIPTMLWILIGNLLGIGIMVFLSDLLFNTDTVVTITEAKAAQTFWEALGRGFMCGALMSLATFHRTPLWLMIVCVAAFILAGFNHCIADAFYLLKNVTLTWNWVGTLIGNTIGGIFLSYRISNT